MTKLSVAPDPAPRQSVIQYRWRSGLGAECTQIRTTLRVAPPPVVNVSRVLKGKGAFCFKSLHMGGSINKAQSSQPYPASRDVYRMAVNDCSFSDKLINRRNAKH